MDGVGGNLNAFTDKESTCYYAKVIDRHVPLAMDVLADMFLRSTFDPQELAKEQKVVLEEIKMYDDSPDESDPRPLHPDDVERREPRRADDRFRRTVARVTPDDLRAHMRAHYAPNSVVVAAAGNVDHDAFVEVVAENFAEFSGRCDLPEPERPQLTPGTLVTKKETEQAYLVLGTGGLSVRDERRYTLTVLDTILGGGMSSRLFQEIREKRGLVYTVYSFQAAYRACGPVRRLRRNVSRERPAVRGRHRRATRPRPHHPVAESELTLAKEHIKGSLTLSLESRRAG